MSQSLNYDYEIFKKYQARFLKLRTVIVPISYFTFHETLESSNEYWRIKNYMIYYNINGSDALESHAEILGKKQYLNIKALWDYYVKGISMVSCSERGWGNTYISESSQNLETTGKLAALRHTIADTSMVNNNIASLQALVDLCAQKKIQVVLLTLACI